MKPRYNHICLTVCDLDHSIAFYERFFGLKTVRRDNPHKGDKVECMTGVKGGELLAAFLSDGELVIELLQFTAERGERRTGLPANEVGCPHLGFVCEDVRAAYESWKEQGVRFLSDPLYSQKRDNWSVMMQDPDGIMIELLEHSALSAEQMALARA